MKKLTTESWVEKAKKKYGNKFDYTKSIYVDSNTKLEIICPQHGSFYQLPGNHMKQNCPNCAMTSKINKLSTGLNGFIIKAKQVHGEKYNYNKVIYKNGNTKIIINCPIHGDFLQVPSSHLSGNGCDKCARDKQSKNLRLTQKEFIERVTELFGDKYNFTNTKYTKSDEDVTYTCPNHGEVITKASNLLAGNGCGKCSGKGLTNDEWIMKAKKIHGDKYDYSKVNYINSQTKVIVGCEEHGDIEIIPANFLLGQGCAKCSGKGLTNDEWIMKAKVIHGDTYGYNNFKYTKAINKTIINCSIHGDFSMAPSDHVNGKQGCPKCGQEKRAKEYAYTFEEVLEKAKQVHGEKYDYSLVEYVKMIDNVKIICPQHGMFEQSMHSHINAGCGCIVCGTGWTKQALLTWVRSMREQLIYLDRVILLDLLENSKISKILKQIGRLEPIRTAQVGSREIETIVNETIEQLENLTEQQIEEVNVNNNNTNDEVVNVIENEFLVRDNNEEENEITIPTLNPIDELDLYDNSMLMKSMSVEEMVDFQKKFYQNKVWNSHMNGYIDISKYDDKVKTNEMKRMVMEEVLSEYNEIQEMTILDDFISINSDGSKRELTQMQKLITIKFRKVLNIGNWSDTGTGKTLGALYSTRDSGCRNIIIICLNSNVDTWKTEIGMYFKNNNIKTKHDFKDRNNIRFTSNTEVVNYLILNVETFQQDNVDIFIKNLTDKNNIDAIIVDEVQSIKTRDDDNISIRTQSVLKLVQLCREIDNKFKLMLMSATPIINNFTEPKNLIELLTGVEHNEINVVENISNGLKLFKLLTRHGIRFRQKKQTNVEYVELELDGSHINIREANIQRGNYLQMEQLLLSTKLDGLLPHIVKGETIIYTEYVSGILKPISEFFTNNNIKVGFYTGNDKEGLIDYRDKNKVDVLVGSKPITTGINGLQHKTSVMIELIPMWTKADRDQFGGRVIDRKGIPLDRKVKYITIIVKLYDDNGELLPDRSQYSKNRVERIKQKGIITDLVLDGQVPKGKLPSRKKLLSDVLSYFDEFENMINNDDLDVIVRKKIELPLNLEEVETHQRKLGDFSEMNRVWSVSNSKTTKERLSENPEEWEDYHTLYREARKNWDEIPYEVIGKKISSRPDWVVGDFGCGENLLSKEINNQVYAFDHIAIDDGVIACDISDVSEYLNDNVLDVVVNSLSLMGSNYVDYLKEEHRTLKPYGIIMICEPKSKWEERENELISTLEEIGFNCRIVRTTDKFIYVDGSKI